MGEQLTEGVAATRPPVVSQRRAARRSGAGPALLRIAAYLAAVVGVAHLFLLSPRIPDAVAPATCVSNVQVSEGLNFTFTCDSPAFLLLAEDPGAIFDDPPTWQSRPGIFVTAYLLNPLLSPLRAVLGQDRYGIDDPRHITYVFINLVLLVLVLVAFERLLRGGRVPWLGVLLLAPLLLFNDVVKAFFWTPHTPILGMLTPLVSVLCCAWVLRTRAAAWWHLGLLGLGLGLLSLAYGLVLGVAIAVGLAVLRAWWQRRPRSLLRLGSDLAGFIAAFALPQLAWIAVVQAKTGGYYSHEVEFYRQVVWITDTLGEGLGTFLDQLTRHQASFGQATWPVLVLPLLLVAVIGAFWATTPGRAASVLAVDRTLAAASALTLAGFGVFLALLGFYQQRLSWTLVPPVLVLGALLLKDGAGAATPRRRAAMYGVVGALVLAMCVWTQVKAGPWS